LYALLQLPIWHLQTFYGSVQTNLVHIQVSGITFIKYAQNQKIGHQLCSKSKDWTSNMLKIKRLDIKYALNQKIGHQICSKSKYWTSNMLKIKRLDIKYAQNQKIGHQICSKSKDWKAK
jgi:hypothetical protein